MLTVDDYIDRASAAQKFKSDRQLSIALGLAAQSVNQWRTKRAWPSDDVMMRLAELAGMDAEQALLDLNRWRAKSDAVSALYLRMAKKIAGVAAAILVFFMFAPLSPATAQSLDKTPCVYYGKYIVILEE